MRARWSLSKRATQGPTSRQAKVSTPRSATCGGYATAKLPASAGPSADGWTIFAVHDSKASWEGFRDSTLMPRMQQGIEGGFTAPPEETGFEIATEIDA